MQLRRAEVLKPLQQYLKYIPHTNSQTLPCLFFHLLHVCCCLDVVNVSCERPPLYFRVILLFFCRTNFWDSMTAAANQDGGYCTAFAVRLRRALKIMLVCCIGGRCLYCTSKESTSSYSCLAATADDFCKNCFAWRLLLLYRVSNQILTNLLKEIDKNWGH